MMRTTILLGAVVAASPAFSQAGDRARAQTWSAGQQLAACHIAGDKKRLEAALIADPASGAFDDWAAQRDKSCTSAAVQTRGDFYRYAVSEALFRREFRRAAPGNFAAVHPLSHSRAPLRFKTMTPQKVRDEDTSLQASAVKLSILGECIVRNDPASAHSLLAANPATDAETTALNMLMPTVGSCVGQTPGVKMQVDDLRGAIAFNYVRLAKAAGGAR